MNNEIKEILDYLKKHFELRPSETELLLDYITNLQEGNKNLLEEVEALQNKNNELIEENIKLKQRIEKVIEYIKEQSRFTEGCDIYKICNKEILLNILQGEDKDE